MDTLRHASAEDELMPRSAPQPQLYSAEQSMRLAERELGPQGAGRDVTCLLDYDGQLAEGVLGSVPRRRAAPRLQALTTEVRRQAGGGGRGVGEASEVLWYWPPACCTSCDEHCTLRVRTAGPPCMRGRCWLSY
jgi:hypothetical protein